MTNAAASTDLIEAAKAGDAARIRAAIAAGADVDYRDTAERTAIMWAARFHHLDATRLLIESGGNPALRDGVNHDAGDISSRHYLERERASAAVRDFIRANEIYQRERAVLTERAHAFAKVLAREYKARIKRQGVFYVNAEYAVTVKHRGMQCCFRVFAGGFDLWVQNFQAGPMVVSLNLEGEDNAMLPERVGRLRSCADVFPALPLYACEDAGADDALRRFVADERVLASLRAIEPGRYEWLVLAPGQLRMRSRTEDLGRIRTRIEAIADLFAHTNRPPAAPLLAPLGIRFGKRGESLPHRFGGATSAPIACPSCGDPLARIAGFARSDERLRHLEWKRDSIEVACCFACALSDVASLTCVSHADAPAVVHQSELSPSGDAEPFAERSFELHDPAGRASGRRSRVGGAPSWIQTDATPACPGCKGTMKFLAQFASTGALMFGADMGMAYAFVCAPCTVVATVIQSE